MGVGDQTCTQQGVQAMEGVGLEFNVYKWLYSLS